MEKGQNVSRALWSLLALYHLLSSLEIPEECSPVLPISLLFIFCQYVSSQNSKN